jgi:DNA-binding transcriptional LysR family regulator
MSELNDPKLRQLDFTLLSVFSEAMRHRKLTVVAETLGLTPSAISHSLKRLREIFGDELFMRRPFGVMPTQRALELSPKIDEIIELSRDAIGAGTTFDAKTSNRLFRIAAPDHELSLFAPVLTRSLRSSAPSVRLSFRSHSRQAALDALSQGAIDVALGMVRTTSTEYERAELFEESYLVLARRGHPAIGKTLTLKTYTRLDHVLVSLGGDLRGIVDATLQRLGATRQVVASVPSFFAAMAVVAGSDAITTVPARMAAANCRRFGLVAYKPPVEIRRFSVSAVWHRRQRNDGGLKWLVGQLAAIAS